MRTISYINQGDVWRYEKEYLLILDIRERMVISENYTTKKTQTVFLDFLLASGTQIQKGNGKNLMQYFNWTTKA